MRRGFRPYRSKNAKGLAKQSKEYDGAYALSTDGSVLFSRLTTKEANAADKLSRDIDKFESTMIERLSHEPDPLSKQDEIGLGAIGFAVEPVGNGSISPEDAGGIIGRQAVVAAAAGRDSLPKESRIGRIIHDIDKTEGGHKILDAGRDFIMKHDKMCAPIAKAVKENNGDRLPWTPKTASVMQLSLDKKYYEAMREPGADMDKVKADHESRMATFRSQMDADGVNMQAFEKCYGEKIASQSKADPNFRDRYAGLSTGDIRIDEHTGRFVTADGVPVQTSDLQVRPVQSREDLLAQHYLNMKTGMDGVEDAIAFSRMTQTPEYKFHDDTIKRLMDADYPENKTLNQELITQTKGMALVDYSQETGRLSSMADSIAQSALDNTLHSEIQRRIPQNTPIVTANVPIPDAQVQTESQIQNENSGVAIPENQPEIADPVRPERPDAVRPIETGQSYAELTDPSTTMHNGSLDAQNRANENAYGRAMAEYNDMRTAADAVRHADTNAPSAAGQEAGSEEQKPESEADRIRREGQERLARYRQEKAGVPRPIGYRSADKNTGYGATPEEAVLDWLLKQHPELQEEANKKMTSLMSERSADNAYNLDRTVRENAGQIVKGQTDKNLKKGQKQYQQIQHIDETQAQMPDEQAVANLETGAPEKPYQSISERLAEMQRNKDSLTHEQVRDLAADIRVAGINLTRDGDPYAFGRGKDNYFAYREIVGVQTDDKGNSVYTEPDADGNRDLVYTDKTPSEIMDDIAKYHSMIPEETRNAIDSENRREYEMSNLVDEAETVVSEQTLDNEPVPSPAEPAAVEQEVQSAEPVAPEADKQEPTQTIPQVSEEILQPSEPVSAEIQQQAETSEKESTKYFDRFRQAQSGEKSPEPVSSENQKKAERFGRGVEEASAYAPDSSELQTSSPDFST